MTPELDITDIRRNRDGVFYVQKYLEKNPVTGKVRRPYRSFPEASTPEEALAMAKAWWAEVTRPLLVSALNAHIDAKRSMGEISAKTASKDRGYVRNHIQPHMGRLRVSEVTPKALTDLYTELLSEGLSQGTVRGIHWFLSGALRRLAEDGVIEANPAQAARHPGAPRPSAVALDETDTASLREHLAAAVAEDPATVSERYRFMVCMAALVALHTGMRVGEVCALRRTDISRLRRTIHVCGTVQEVTGVGTVRQPHPKTVKSDRQVAMGPALQAVATDYDSRRGRILGGRFAGKGAPWLTVNGTWLRPSYVSKRFKQLATSEGWVEAADGLTFHTLRHTHVSIMLAQGTGLKEVSERIGHSDESTTLRTYAHMLPGRDRAAAEGFDAFFGGGGA